MNDDISANPAKAGALSERLVFTALLALSIGGIGRYLLTPKRVCRAVV